MSSYRVTGPLPYMGHQPGETFEAELTPEQEARALERGAIKPAKKPKTEEVDDAEADRAS